MAHMYAEKVKKYTGRRNEMASLEGLAALSDDMGKDLTAEADNIIAEIDGVLEENAQEFVDNFIQKGGQ